MNTATANHFPDKETARVAANFGMWVFLATEILFFAPLLLGYTYCRVIFPQGFAAASRHTEIVIGTLNTAILLTSSFTMAMAVELQKTLSLRTYRLLLGLTAMFGAAFLVLKGFEYHHEWDEHLFPDRHFQFEHGYAHTAQLFFFLYFALTGIHALHLSIGIAWVSLLALKKNKLENDNLLSNAGLYWHFVDIVWIFLYPLIYLVSRHG